MYKIPKPHDGKPHPYEWQADEWKKRQRAGRLRFSERNPSPRSQLQGWKDRCANYEARTAELEEKLEYAGHLQRKTEAELDEVLAENARLRSQAQDWQAVAGRLVGYYCPDGNENCDACLAELFFEAQEVNGHDAGGN